MRRCLFALLTIFISAPVHADEATHPGVRIGSGYADPSGDDPYGPLDWCGELLWLDFGETISLVDPSTRQPVRQFKRESDRGLIACQTAAGRTFAWTDTVDDVLTWRAVDGSGAGALRGVVRGEYSGVPLFDVFDVLAVGLNIEVEQLPDQVQLGVIDPSALQPLLDAATVVQDGQDPLRATIYHIHLLDKRLLFMEIDRSIKERDIWQHKLTITILEAKLESGSVSLGRQWDVDELFRLGIGEDPSEFSVNKNGKVVFSVDRGEGKESCTLDTRSAESDLECRPLAETPSRDALRVTASPNVPVLATSPSGKWTAWAEWTTGDDDDDESSVQFYLAPTADLLKP
jgi:hypothetical protein